MLAIRVETNERTAPQVIPAASAESRYREQSIDPRMSDRSAMRIPQREPLGLCIGRIIGRPSGLQAIYQFGIGELRKIASQIEAKAPGGTGVDRGLRGGSSKWI